MKLRLELGGFLLGVFFTAAFAQPSPYFPRTGANAKSEILREIHNPSVYLVLALAPGFEDRSTIASFRVGTGAAVAVAFLTNGEDIPSDLNGEMFYQLASRRKEEAYRAMSSLGAQPYFLNIPVDELSADPECFRPSEILRTALTGQLDSVITRMKPDVIILESDPLSAGKKSARLEYLQRLVLANLRNKKKTVPWNINRCFLQTMERRNSVAIPVEHQDPVWRESPLEMGRKAGQCYLSLKHQLPLWSRYSPPFYVQSYPHGTKPVFPLNKGLPEIGKQLKTLLPAIRSVESSAVKESPKQQLAVLGAAIVKTDALIRAHSMSMGQSDRRVLSSWKLGLENLRCNFLHVEIQYTASDSILTALQVFFLKFGRLDSAFNKGKTQIVFPGVVEKQWIANESQETFYDLKDSAQFRVLSPKSLSLTSTETPQGFEALQVRTPFVFIVSHQDPDQNRNFMYREELPLIIAPYRSAEVLTPQVVWGRDTSVCIRFRSNIRDKTRGKLYISDSMVSSPEREIEFPGKNYIELDTLPLSWKNTPLDAPRQVTIWTGPKSPAGNFVVKPLDVAVRAKTAVALCSAIDNGAVESALRRLGVPPMLVDSTNLPSVLLGRSAMIIDQFSSGKFAALNHKTDSVEQWLNRGGTLIILTQSFSEQNLPPGDGVAFTSLPAGGYKERLVVDSTNTVLRSPNDIQPLSFDDERFVTSYCGLGALESIGAKAVIRAGDRVFLLERHIGKGKIFYCSLNLFPRLLTIDKASYGLLANLVSAGSE